MRWTTNRPYSSIVKILPNGLKGNHYSTVFRNAADEYERATGTMYREIEIALPREPTPKQQLVANFVKVELAADAIRIFRR